jgi:hypothetical protein
MAVILLSWQKALRSRRKLLLVASESSNKDVSLQSSAPAEDRGQLLKGFACD